MALGPMAGVIPRLRTAALGPHAAVPDAELLDRFLAARDAGAFEALVRRHGPMVLAVCSRVLRRTHDAEDAFQATFLVLALKAATVSPRNRLAGWLHGVAYNTARKARHRAARRAAAEAGVPSRSAEPMPPEPCPDDPASLLDRELAALPDRYRVPIVCCDLEGRPRVEVAVALGCSEGTLSSRLTRGRRLLADRLRRRGVVAPLAALGGGLVSRPAALAEPLIRAIVPAALSAVSASGTVTGALSPSVAELATGVIKSMFLQKLQALALGALAVVAAAAVALVLTGLAPDRSGAAPVPKAAPGSDADDKAVTEALADMDGRLLMNRKVLKDIKCDFDQYDKIMDRMESAQKLVSKATSEAMGQLKFNAGPGANPEAFSKMIRDAQEAGMKELRKVVVVVVADLTPAQRKRLRQIDLQARGHEAFATPAVAKVLDLTAKQKEQFEANAKQVEQDLTGVFMKPGGAIAIAGPGGGVTISGGAAADLDTPAREVRAEGLKRALGVLTEEQKGVWKKLIGEPFAHPLDRPVPARAWSTGGVIQGGAAPALPALPAVPGVKIAPGVVRPLPVPPPAANPGK